MPYLLQTLATPKYFLKSWYKQRPQHFSHLPHVCDGPAGTSSDMGAFSAAVAQQKRGGLGCSHVKGACGLQAKKNLQKGRVTLGRCRSSFSLVLLHCCLTNLTDTAALHWGVRSC